MSETVVIVGAGQAGLQTAISLRQGGFDGRVILLGAEAHLPYQRPPLSKQVLKGEFDAERCTLRSADFLAGQDIDFRPGVRATGLDRQRRFVQLEQDQVIDYDHLVIATGSRLNRIEVSGSRLADVDVPELDEVEIDEVGQLVVEAHQTEAPATRTMLDTALC